MASNVGALAFMAPGKAGATYDMYTYVPYAWKRITAIRKRTPWTVKAGGGDGSYFESASLAKTVDLICEGPIEGFSDRSGETIRFFQDSRLENIDFLKSIYLNDTQILSERDGTFNFRVFDADFRRGDTMQEIFPDSYRSHGKTVMYNTQLFPANVGEGTGPKASLGLNQNSEFVSVDGLPLNEEGKAISDTMLALELSFTDPTVNKRISGHIDKVHKRALHNTFKKHEKHLHPVVHTVTDPNVEVVSIAIDIHALSRLKVGKRTTETRTNDFHFLIYANNEGEPSIDNPPILEVTPEMAAGFKEDFDKFGSDFGSGGKPGNEKFILNNQTFDTYSRYNDGELIENDTGGFFVRRMQGLATSDYIFETIIHLPPNPKGKKRVIRVSRLDSDEEFRGDDTETAAASLHSITEIVPCQLYHPNSAIIGTTIDSRAFSSVPLRKYLLKLLKMKVPSNYLPDTKEYIGNWNGKFKAKHVINTASGDVLGGTSLSSYRVREPKAISQGGGLVVVSTSTKKHGSGALLFPASDGYGTNSHGNAKAPLEVGEYEENKVLYVKDPYTVSSRSATKGGLDKTSVASFGTFGSSNFTIEFFIKTSATQVKDVYNLMSPSATPDSDVGVEGVTKVLVASEQNAGLGWSIDTGVPDLGEMGIFPDQLDALIGDDELSYLDTGRLIGGAWRVEIGTKDSSDEEHVDLGKIRFRAFMPGGNLSLMTSNSSLGRVVQLYPGWDKDLSYVLVGQVASTTNVADNNWHHVAISRNGNTVSIFVDGTKEAESACASEIYGFKHIVGDDVHKGEVQIGGTRTPYKVVGKKFYGTSFNGYLDEVMISRKAKYIEDFNAAPDNLRSLMQNEFSTLLYINADNRANASTDIFDHVEAVIDTSFKFDEDAEFDQAELQWTDNPAWILYDLITNKRYGLGKYGLKAYSVDKWNLYEIAKYCDEKVRTGLDPKHAAREFQVIYTNGSGSGLTPYFPTVGQTHIMIGNPNSADSLFSSQGDFEKEFPEFSTIALYNLNDDSAPVHKRIKYLRRGAVGGKSLNERYGTNLGSDAATDKLISYQAANKDTAGYAIVEIQRLVSTEEALRVQPGLESWVRAKKSYMSNPKNAAERAAREKRLILHYIDNPDNSKSNATKAFDVGSAINSTSISGSVATEFYGNFDILEPRFSANLYITTQVDAYKLLNDIASIFRGITYFANGKIYAYFDKKRDAVFNFTNANVKDGTFVYAGSSKAERFTTCVVRYVDKYENYKPKIEYVEDPDGIVKYGIIEKELVAFGCASRSQAKRLGRWFLFSSQYETETVEFSAGKESAYLRPGDVVKIIDKTRTQKRFGGRVVDFVSGELKVKVDQNLSKDYIGENIHITIVNDFEFSDSLDEKVDKIVLSEEGEIKQKTVTDDDISNVRKSQVRTYRIKDIEPDTSLVPVENRIVELESVGGDPPLDFGKIKIGSIFILNQKNADVEIQENLFKVVNVSQVNDLEYTVQAMQYVESKFDLSDNKLDHKINLKYSKSPIEYTRPAKPIGVPRISVVPLNNGLERELTVTWEAVVPTPEKYKVVIALHGGVNLSSASSSGLGKKFVLEKSAKNESSEVVDTSVSVNIGDYTGEIDVSIYSVDSEGNLDLIYY